MNEPDLVGPYKPTWTLRRLVVFATLAWCMVVLPVVVLLAKPSDTATAAVWAVSGIMIVVARYYLVQPTIEAVKLAEIMKP